MSQADNIAWVETEADIRQMYQEAAMERAEESFALNLGDAFGAKGLIVTSTAPRLQDAFAAAFPEKTASTLVRNFYHVDQVSDDGIVKLSGLSSVPGKPAVGVFNAATQDILVLEKGPLNYGFVNAMALGAFSRLCLDTDAYQYAHAACLDIGGKGVLIIGDHKAGKSTLISKILSEAENMRDIPFALASDDWVVLKADGNTAGATRLSQEYRIDNGTVQNPALGLSLTFNALMGRYATPGSDKASIPLDALCAELGIASVPHMSYDLIVVMDPKQQAFMQTVDENAAFRILAASTANVSPLTAGETQKHRVFWQEQFATRKAVSINNRHAGKSIQEVAKSVINLAMK